MGVLAFVFVLVDAWLCMWCKIAIFDEVRERTCTLSDFGEFVIIRDCNKLDVV